MEWSDVSDVEEEQFPQSITVIKAVSYDIKSVLEEMDRLGNSESNTWTLEDVISIVSVWASVDFGCGWGHQVDPSSLIYTDELGNVLYAPADEE